MIPGSFPNLSVKLCHTTAETLGTNFADNYTGNTPVAVYSNSAQYLSPAANEWFGFTFTTPFEYDGHQNLLVELEWEGSGYAAVGTWWGQGSGRFCHSYVLNGNPVSGYPNAGAIENCLHYMRITVAPNAVEPHSLGRVKGVFK